MHYFPKRIVVEKNAQDQVFTQAILQRLRHLPIEVVDGFDWQKAVPPKDDASHWRKGKRILYLKKFLGLPIKPCPGFSPKMLCCGYHTLDFIENCPLECAYCILQALHNRPLITFHTNVEEVCEKIQTTISARSEQYFRIGTGEHSDSLALDHLFELNPYLVELFGKFPNASLELKTKSANIQPLLGLQHNGQTVVSWSLNSAWATKTYEWKTASLQQRLNAAKTLAQEGYKLGFHFDPLIYEPNWQKNYQQAVDQLFNTAPVENIVWISLGSLRYMPSLKTIAEQRFARLDLFRQEQVLAKDGKMRYLRPIREEMLATVAAMIKKHTKNIPLYLCMESAKTWQNALAKPVSGTASSQPKNPAEMEKNIRAKLSLV